MGNSTQESRRYVALRYALLISGCLVTLIGTGHIFMPAWGYDPGVPRAMSAIVSDHFYYLGTYAIAAFLLTLGFISIYVSFLPYPRISFTVSLAFGFLWITRAILEVIYPVKLRLFFLDTPTLTLLPVICVIAAVYCIGAASYLLIKHSLLRNRPPYNQKIL